MSSLVVHNISSGTVAKCLAFSQRIHLLIAIIIVAQSPFSAYNLYFQMDIHNFNKLLVTSSNSPFIHWIIFRILFNFHLGTSYPCYDTSTSWCLFLSDAFEIAACSFFYGALHHNAVISPRVSAPRLYTGGTKRWTGMRRRENGAWTLC